MANEYILNSEVVAAAREYIRTAEDGCVVSIWELLKALSDKFGEQFTVSPEVHRVVGLIEELWDDQHIDPVTNLAAIEFAWIESPLQRSDFSESELRNALVARFNSSA